MIRIGRIPHHLQRYNTLGDWQVDSYGDLVIDVSEMGNSDFELLVGVHELIEAALCRKRGITQAQVDAFDLAHPDLDEPGADISAPYYREHKFACLVEKLLADELGIDFAKYDAVQQQVVESWVEPKATQHPDTDAGLQP